MNLVKRNTSGNGFTKTKRKFSKARPTNRTARKKAVSTLDPSSLIKKPTKPVQEEIYYPSSSFEKMAIAPSLKANLSIKGYTYPTQIQEETIEHLIGGTDLIGVASTGTGKTGAFLIPIIHQLITQKKSIQALVVVPTRELALQVEQEFKSLANGLGLFSACFIGGTSINKNLASLRRRNHIIIGTPGRILDLTNRGAFKIQEISSLVLDEFDRMLDMGFKHDIMKMIQSMPKRRQTMLFSATIDKSQSTLIQQIVSNPIEVKVSSGLSTSDQVEQDVVHVPHGSDKINLLLSMMDDEDFEKVLVFTETKRQADKVSKQLNASGVRSDQIHGNKSQNYRNTALNRFKRGIVRVLVATDVAARGIDVADITHVINYQLPLSFDSYAHRIGRTGRAGKPGKAFTFVDA